MALNDTKLQRLQAKARAYQVADGGGHGSRKEKVTLGEYPAHTLSEARLWREQCQALLAHGHSPAIAKQAEKAVPGAAQAGRAADIVAAVREPLVCRCREPHEQRATQHPPRARQGCPVRDRR